MFSNRFLDQIKQRYERYPFLFQLPGWVLYIVLPYLIISLPQFFSQREILKLAGVRVFNDSLSILFFYVNYYYLTPEVLKKRRPQLLWLSVLGMGVLLTVANSLYYYFILKGDMEQIAMKLLQKQLDLQKTEQLFGTPMPLLITSFLSLLLLTSVSSGFAVYKDRNQHKAEHQQMIIEKKDAELSALKLQISPHFLFNTLNNMRWLARQKSDRTEDAIMRLSDILRYMIYQVDLGPVILAREIEYLSDYIELQQMRLASNNRVVFDKLIDCDRALIEPLLLIHFVENAFKHGMHHELESAVTIRLHKQDTTLLFSTRNRLFMNGSTAISGDSGIGIQNVERRLALHYPNRHTLRIFVQNGLFCVDLRIDLDPILDEATVYSGR